jgi:hypothetical protein
MRLPLLQCKSLSLFAKNLLLVVFALQIMGIFPIQALAVSQLTSSPVNLRFGNIDIGQSQTLLVTITNNGGATMTINGISSSNPEFSAGNLNLPLALASGQSFDLTVTFAPQTIGWTSGNIQCVCSPSGAPFYLPVAGTGVSNEALAASPSVLSFGQVAIGGKASLPAVITNNRNWSITIASIQSTNGEFSVSGPSLPAILQPGQSIDLTVAFSPQSTGLIGGSVFVNPGLVVPFTGTGAQAVGQLILSPAPLNFGDVNVGTTSTQSLLLSATGASVTVSSAASGSSQFVLDGAVFPFTIAAGQSQSFNVAFTPQNSGVQSASLTFVSNASDSQAAEALSGTGTVPSYSVGLYWNSSPDVVGYNVYRAGSNGAYQKINSSLDPSTAYTDSTVASGQTYYYAATSVNSTGEESAKSTPSVEAVVP